MSQTSERPQTIVVTAEYDGTKILTEPEEWNRFVIDHTEQLRAQVAAAGHAWNEGITSAAMDGYAAGSPPNWNVTLRVEWVPRTIVKATECLHHPGRPVHEHCSSCGLPLWPDEEPGDHECPPGFDL